LYIRKLKGREGKKEVFPQQSYPLGPPEKPERDGEIFLPKGNETEKIVPVG